MAPLRRAGLESAAGTTAGIRAAPSPPMRYAAPQVPGCRCPLIRVHVYPSASVVTPRLGSGRGASCAV